MKLVDFIIVTAIAGLMACFLFWPKTQAIKEPEVQCLFTRNGVTVYRFKQDGYWQTYTDQKGEPCGPKD